jgi:hypothetical protein
VLVSDPARNVGIVDVRPMRPTSANAPWQKAIDARDEIAKVVRDTLAHEEVAALVYQSESGNYPPWLRFEAWLPDPVAGGTARQRSELEVVVDVRPYRKHTLVTTIRLLRGERKLTLPERTSLTRPDIEEWTRHAIDRGPRPQSYRPIVDTLLSIAGTLIPPLHPRYNRIAEEFRHGFWRRPLLALFSLYLLVQLLLEPAADNPALQLVVAVLSLAIVAGAIGLSISYVRRRRVVAVTPEPVSAPRNLVLVDSWSSAIAGLGSDFEAVRQRLLSRVGEAQSLGADCRLERYSYRTPEGYEERERLVVARDQGHVHIHINPFACDLFVGWEGFLNWAQWTESAPVNIKIGSGMETQFIELRSGSYVPQQFDLMDLNSLSAFVHSRIEKELRSILKEKAIDQEIDFEIVRSDRGRALDRSRHGSAGHDAAGIWARIFKTAAAWQPAALTALRKSAAEPAAPAGSRFPPALGLPLLGLAFYLIVYMSGLWGTGQDLPEPWASYGPVPNLMFAAIFSLGMSWYAAVRLPGALAGATVLFVLTSLIAAGRNAAADEIFDSVAPADLPAAVAALSLASDALVSASIMLIAGALAPSLHRRSYWLIALILWPAAGYYLALAFSTVRVLTADSDFAALLFQHLLILGCIGYWLGNRR